MKFRNAFFLLGPLVFVAFGFYTKHQDLGEDILLRAINMNLQNAHYDPIAIDDDFSEKAFQLYIDNLDANKRLFLQSDIDELNYFKTTIDDEIINGTSAISAASLAAFRFLIIVPVGTNTLPPMWPHFFSLAN